MHMLVQDFLYRSAERSPDKLALVCDGRRLTYAELDEATNRLANALIDCGIGRGDRVIIILDNSVEAVISIFATLKAGAVFVAIHSTTKPGKLTYYLNNCQAGALIFDSRKLDAINEVFAEVPSLKVGVCCEKDSSTSIGHDTYLSFTTIQKSGSNRRPRNVNIDLDLACLVYTSGTTGDPKGVMSDHSNVVFVTESIIEYLGNTANDIILCALPLSFVYGLYHLLMVLRFGGTLVLERGFTYPAAVLKRIEAEKVTGMPIVPTIMAVLLQMDLSAYNLSSLRYITNAAAALPPSHIQDFKRRCPDVTIFSMYGLTETKRALYLPPDQLEKRPGSVGIAIPGTEVWLEDETGRRVLPGEVGELVIRGRHVMRGYWGDPEATAARFRPGPLPNERICYSGDLFRMDEDGYLYFVSRKDDIIKSRGEKVAPREIENVLYQLPGVVEVAVVGVDDPLWGQAIKVFLVCQGNPLTEAEVLAYCRSKLEDLMIPKYIEFRDELPKTDSGKIRKQGLWESRG